MNKITLKIRKRKFDKMKNLTKDYLRTVTNKSLVQYAHIYETIENATMEQIESFGLPLSKRDHHNSEKHNKLRDMGAIYRNNCKSVLSNGRISSACEACQKGTGSYTTFVSLKCHRDCYFCFNKNQDDYKLLPTKYKKNVNEDINRV